MGNRKSSLAGFVSVLALTAFFGCTSRQADSQAKADLQQWFENRWPGVIQIVEYEAMNKARDGEDCVIEYRARARVVKDAGACVQTCCGDICIDRLVDGFRWIEKKPDAPRSLRKGDSFEMQGRKKYAKYEKGWSCE